MVEPPHLCRHLGRQHGRGGRHREEGEDRGQPVDCLGLLCQRAHRLGPVVQLHGLDQLLQLPGHRLHLRRGNAHHLWHLESPRPSCPCTISILNGLISYEMLSE